MNNQTIIELFSGVIDEESLESLSPEELNAIKEMLTNAGY